MARLPGWYHHAKHGWLPQQRGTDKKRAARARFKRALFEQQHGHCFWCPREIRLYEAGIVGGTLPADYATWDHLDDRLSGERGKHPGEVRTVLACPKCNHDRGAASVRAAPIERLHHLSGRAPYLATLGVL